MLPLLVLSKLIAQKDKCLIFSTEIHLLDLQTVVSGQYFPLYCEGEDFSLSSGVSQKGDYFSLSFYR
jgi:hypothetical protein